eukprot:XP_011609581.1 PREDICTED: ankyrin repeat domain-containing protein SOWAHA-like [Takifugu rubripes]
MALTQESVLFRLINEGGQVKKSEIVSHFRGLLDGVDPAEKQRNRELFKTFVNSVATVREIDGVRYVVLKKVYQHLLKRVQAAEEPDHGEIRRTEPMVGNGALLLCVWSRGDLAQWSSKNGTV